MNKENKLILLDAGGVLVSSYTSEKVAHRIADQSGCDRQDSWDHFKKHLYHPVWTGQRNEQWLWTQWLQWADLPVDYESWHQWAVESVVPLPGARTAVERLSGLAPVWLLSNHCDTWLRPGLTNAGFIQHLQRVFISSETGGRKPEMEAYRQVLKAWNRQPGSILYVDDNLEYLQPAAKLGVNISQAQTSTEWLAVAEDFLAD